MTTTPAIPSDTALNILIRRTLLTLNDANLSGNYSVLRDLAAPSFQEANDAKKLSGTFADMRSGMTDMAPVVNFHPRLASKPELTKSGLLRLKGFMPTRPKHINFAMEFEKNDERWLLKGIALKLSTPKATAAPKGEVSKNEKM